VDHRPLRQRAQLTPGQLRRVRGLRDALLHASPDERVTRSFDDRFRWIILRPLKYRRIRGLRMPIPPIAVLLEDKRSCPPSKPGVPVLHQCVTPTALPVRAMVTALDATAARFDACRRRHPTWTTLQLGKDCRRR
jgi:hypothetical protein